MAEGWTELALPPGAEHAWAHPGAAVGPDGTLSLGAPDGRTIARFDSSGAIGTVRVDAIECHGIAIDQHQRIWVADPGFKSELVGGRIVTRRGEGQVLLAASDGRTIRRLRPPSDGWRPTGVALDAFGRGSDGRIWVTDGYGAHLVHCFDADGTLRWTVDGSASGTRFDTPHGVVVDGRGDRPRILVADRGNQRIVAFDPDGAYLGEFGQPFLTSPSGLSVDEERLWVSELHGCVVAFGSDDALALRIGSIDAYGEPGWPNAVDGERVVPPRLDPGRLRSPHGIAVLPSGNVAVAEWVLGGRLVLLATARCEVAS